MFKRFTLPLLVTIFSISSAFSQAGLGGSIKGKVLDELSDGMPFVNVAIYQFGNMKGGATTDMEGQFKLSNLDAGSYDLEVKFSSSSSVVFTTCYFFSALYIFSNSSLTSFPSPFNQFPLF